MKNDIATVLDECIARIRQGTAPDACLEEHPDMREQLEPLLRTALSVSALPRVAPSEEFVIASRARLMAQINREAQPQKARSGTAPGGLAVLREGLRHSLAGARGVAIAAALALILISAASLGALNLLSPSSALASQATLSILSGSVEVQKAGSPTIQPGSDGMTLATGDRVRTASGSHALLTFFEGSTIKLEPQTDLEIQQAEAGDTQGTSIVLRQWTGKTWSRVVKMADPGSHYQIITPSATAIVRGTLFATEVDDSGATRVATTEGLVSVAAQGTEVQLPPSLQTRVVAGAVPSPPAAVPASNSALVITVEAPAIASLRDPTGSSTGYLPDGLSFNQIPGSRSSLPDGTQQITIPQPASGEYLLALRYTGEAPARFNIQGQSGGETPFEYTGKFSAASGDGWLIRLKLQVEDGLITASSISSVSALGNEKPEKIAPTASSNRTPQPANSNAGGSPASTDKAEQGDTKDNKDNDGSQGNPPAGNSAIDRGDNEGNTSSSSSDKAEDKSNQSPAGSGSNREDSGDGNTPQKDDEGNKGNTENKGNSDNKGNSENQDKDKTDQGNSSDKDNRDNGNRDNNSDKSNKNDDNEKGRDNSRDNDYRHINPFDRAGNAEGGNKAADRSDDNGNGSNKDRD